MTENRITPSIMPKKLRDDVVKLTEEDLAVEREIHATLEMLKSREDKQRLHDERRAAVRKVSGSLLLDEAAKEARISKKNAQKQKLIDKRRLKKALRSKK